MRDYSKTFEKYTNSSELICLEKTAYCIGGALGPYFLLFTSLQSVDVVVVYVLEFIYQFKNAVT